MDTTNSDQFGKPETPVTTTKPNNLKIFFRRNFLYITIPILVLGLVVIGYFATSFFTSPVVERDTKDTSTTTPTLSPTNTVAPTLSVTPSTLQKNPTLSPTRTNTNSTAATNTPTPQVATKKYGISGYAFQDDNSNQVRDNGEPGLSGVLVTFISQGKQVTTDGGGRFAINDLAPGTYNVTANSIGGMNGTTANPAFVTITDGDATVDFGFK